jgi:hypothetical protein
VRTHPDRDRGRAPAGQPGGSRSAVRNQRRRHQRSDDGRFDDLLAKAVAHHAASESGLPVPPRTVALSPDTAIKAGPQALNVSTETLEWISRQMRGNRRSNRTPTAMIAAIVGVAALLWRNCRTCSTSGCNFSRKRLTSRRRGYFPPFLVDQVLQCSRYGNKMST